MKYKVLHSHVHKSDGSTPFKRDDIVTKKDLTDAGHDVDFLLRNDAVEALPGTEDIGEVDAKSVKGVAEEAGPNVSGRRGAAGKS